MTLSQPAADVLAPSVVHRDVVVVETSPLRVVTTPRQWAYAVTFPLRHDGSDASERLRQFGGRVVLDLSVVRGVVGAGVTNSAGDAYLIEKFASDSRCQMSLLVPAGASTGAIVLRNASAAGASEFILTDVRIESLEDAFVYPVQLAARDVEQEAIPPDGDSGTVFDTDAASRINAARQDWLKESGLVRTGSRVLDAGAGVGHFVPFYLERGCSVVAIDGRVDNIAMLRRRFPMVEATVADVQRFDPQSLGTFDVIHCFGLLYHLESPIAALRAFRQLCRGLLILETMICDSSASVSVLADETKAASQALEGLGCRPSPAFVTLALNRVGFRYVYGANPPPRHEDFQFEWRNNLDIVRDNHPLRSVFVASHAPLDHERLLPLVD
jgi:SAM-dependent methyltransferase